MILIHFKLHMWLFSYQGVHMYCSYIHITLSFGYSMRVGGVLLMRIGGLISWWHVLGFCPIFGALNMCLWRKTVVTKLFLNLCMTIYLLFVLLILGGRI